ncbi:MAG: restriction endonuclease subunit S [Ignavibacteria bacterium]|nr:restriction endonuclease subunit S [Ignavibacteria bacterium]
MEVKPDYKQTELGVIPEEWTVIRLGDLMPFVTSGSRGWASYYSERGDLFVRITNLSRSTIYLDLTDSRFVKLPIEAREGVRTQLNEHDVLISITADIGIVGYVDASVPSPAYINQHIALVRFDPLKVSGRFVSYFLASERPQKLFRAATDTGAKAGMSLLTVRKIKTALPSLAEQRAIEEALGDVDALLSGLDQLISKKRDLKQAAMQQLLTGQTRLPGFHGEWEVKRLGDVASLSKGTQLHSSETDEDGKFAHLNGGITPSGYTHKSNTDGNTIAISEGGNSCGFVQFMSDPYWCGGHCYSVIPKSMDNRFLYHALKSQQSEIMGLRVGSGLPNVQKTGLLDFKIKLPVTHHEQTAIAEVLTEMDVELTALELRREKTNALKQGMMQELLTGKTRLVKLADGEVTSC